ncbi:MAG: tRNA (N6-isopentenyl adenosine(37)-C2)-methylthiotransferase MiaB [Candidatus Solincola sediminis]|uniref:tRNA-2-methylthio-N(6)-dimethylallyladenosine synthase n=1 Tax=Candidatus Solincola sediminis TaxID=1797199 RepID=A0A1F2WGF5_9ACTN|nr:MAG: tRNA (N6-isopentenyl adenosine(37)-C2)-methylthiotransferase MiaB [Candidatus Solincola sediminis]OFW56266.1 MAG: tRNA (N6-isopentenyl adenosine(37)-C2)-methylthiotransferase MiaB [Candidatus Solincola sediminis]
MNRHDAEQIAGALEGAGWSLAESEEEANSIILLTCCVRESAEQRLYGRLASLKSLKQARPVKIAVGGCLAQKVGERMLHEMPHVDLVFGTQQYPNIAVLLEAAENTQVCATNLEGLEFGAGTSFRREQFRAWITITHGCQNFCSYCIVPFVRGPEVSRTIEEVVDEVARHVSGGAREINLLGQNVNSYRLREDGETKFPRLLRILAERFPDTWVRFTTSHPRDLNQEIIGAIAESRTACEHIHLPLQAGSDRILAAMNRGYTAAEYVEKAQDLRRLVSDISLTTDLIVGFPGETEDDFAKTMEVVEACGFDSSFTFIYNSREGTAAARINNDIPGGVKQERLERLMQLTRKLTGVSLARELGREISVMVTGPSRKDPRRWSARSRNNRIVHFERQDADLTGRLAKVVITEAGSWSLKAELLEIID